MWCTIQGIFVLCVVNVVTTMVIGTNIGAHNKALIGVQKIGVTLDNNGGNA